MGESKVEEPKNQDLDKVELKLKSLEAKQKDLDLKNTDRKIKVDEGETDVKKLEILKDILEASFMETIEGVSEPYIKFTSVFSDKEAIKIKEKLFEVINRL
jgi:hypothetical protein